MNLSIRERLMTLKVLPKEGNYSIHLRLCLSFTDEEVEDLKIVSGNGQMSWVGDRIVDIPINEKDTALIAEAFKNAHREKRLLPDAMSAYEKFVSE